MPTPTADQRSAQPEARPETKALAASGVGGRDEPTTQTGAPPPSGYSRAQVWLHWLIAALILIQLTVNDAVRIAFRLRLRDEPAELEVGAMLHLANGFAILALTLIRLGLRLRIGAPPPPQGGPWLFEWMGILAHWGLYALLLAMVLTGAMAWFVPSATAATLHEIGRLALVALILAHILGALVEHYLFENKVIRRMRLR